MRRAGFDLWVLGRHMAVYLADWVPLGVLHRDQCAYVHPKTDMAQIVDGKNVMWAVPR